MGRGGGGGGVVRRGARTGLGDSTGMLMPVTTRGMQGSFVTTAVLQPVLARNAKCVRVFWGGGGLVGVIGVGGRETGRSVGGGQVAV